MLLYTNPATGQAGCECGELPYTVTVTFDGLSAEDGACLPKLDGQTVVLRDATPKTLVRVVVQSPWARWAPRCLELDTSSYDGVPCPIPPLDMSRFFQGNALAYARRGRTPPPIQLFTFQGSGATFTPAYEQTVDYDGLPAWRIASVAVAGGGAGYTDGAVVTWGPSGVFWAFSPWDFPLQVASILRVRTREEPVVVAAATPPQGSGVTPATLAVTMARNPGYPATWSVASVAVVDGGSGYPTDRPVTFSVAAPNVRASPASAVAHVGDGGAVQFVRVHNGGAYFRNEGKAVEVEVAQSGLYYGESNALPAIVAPLEVFVEQLAPSNGSGAEVEYTINTDPYSPTFGAIALTLANPGSGYSLLGGGTGNWQVNCESAGGMVLDLTRHQVECEGDGRNLNLRLRVAGVDGWIIGPNIAFDAAFQSAGPVVNASDLPALLTAAGSTRGGTVELSAGGRYIGPQGPCCSSCPASFQKLAAVASITVAVQLAYDPCGANGSRTLVLEAQGPDGAWSARQQVGTMEVAAALGAAGGFYFLGITVTACAGIGLAWAAVNRSLRMDAVRLGSDCVPVGFDDWQWAAAAAGQQYVPFVRGNELCCGVPEDLVLNASATVVLA
jgi:hypothetical protein